jgi:hypothetical protein
MSATSKVVQEQTATQPEGSFLNLVTLNRQRDRAGGRRTVLGHGGRQLPGSSMHSTLIFGKKPTMRNYSVPSPRLFAATLDGDTGRFFTPMLGFTYLIM